MSLAEGWVAQTAAPGLSMRARLKAATDELHQALHRAAPFAAIADQTATRESYADTLVFLNRYHAAMAGWCAAGAQALGVRALAKAHRERLSALAQDLAFFGRAAPVVQMEQEAPRPAAFAAGVLYTVQGSTLGGKLIHRQLDTLLADNRGRLFFKGGAHDSHHWRFLCEALEHQTDAAGLESGARHAFGCFGTMLAETIPVP